MRNLKYPGWYLVCVILVMVTLGTVHAQETDLVFTKTPADAAVLVSGWADTPIFMSDPVVFTDEEGGLHLFFTAIFCEKDGQPYYAWDPANQMDCMLTSANGSTGYAFSDDQGLTWTIRETPVIVYGPEEWDNEKIETPFVTQAGDTLYLFYCATGNKDGKLFAQRYQIGVATLALNGRSVKQALLVDGDPMGKQPTPLLAYNLDERSVDNNVQEPSVVVRDGVLELYYTGLGFALPDQGLDAPGQSITSINFLRATFDLDLNPLDEPQKLQVEPAINMPEVHYVDGMYYGFYTIAGPGADDVFHHNEVIGYMTSPDGLTWTDAGIILEPGVAGSFDDWGVMAPTVSFQDDQIILFYSGWELADHAAFPVAPDGRFGIPISDTQTVHGNFGRAVSTTLR